MKIQPTFSQSPYISTVNAGNPSIDLFLNIATIEWYYNIQISLNIGSANFTMRVWW